MQKLCIFVHVHDYIAQNSQNICWFYQQINILFAFAYAA